MINSAEIELLREALDTLEAGFRNLPPFTPDFDIDRARDVLQATATRMQDNYPYHHPQYAGQMLKPPHAVARIAYAMSLWINPNNHALDGSRASSPMEAECVRELGQMFGWDQPLGHLTGGGTMANLEALWVAGRLHPGKKVVASAQAHYTHSRISDVLGLAFEPLPVAHDGRIDVAALESLLAEGDVGTVVATIGNTGLGAVDPLPDILALRDRFDFRLHADAAYGGYFGLASALEAETAATYDRLFDVDSIVIDPHKHGLQPYGCGCVLFRDPSVGRFYKHDSPYTYFSSAELHLGEISLECSRPGSSAVALWATQQMFPLERNGRMAGWLDDSILAARDLHARLENSEAYRPLMPPELDIVVYALDAPTSSASGKRAQGVFESAARKDLHLATISVPAELAEHYLPDMEMDTDSILCMRSVMMKPEQRDWIEPIMAILEDCAAA